MIAVQSLLGFTPATGETRTGFYWDPAMGVHRAVTTNSNASSAAFEQQGAANAA
jgi:hypothetical protein